MATLQNRRTVFSLSNSEVMSNSAPSSEAGITKSEGHDGFFIYSDKAFTLWLCNLERLPTLSLFLLLRQKI